MYYTYSLQNNVLHVQSTQLCNTRIINTTKYRTFSLHNQVLHVQSTHQCTTRTVYRTMYHTYSLHINVPHVQSTHKCTARKRYRNSQEFPHTLHANDIEIHKNFRTHSTQVIWKFTRISALTARKQYRIS